MKRINTTSNPTANTNRPRAWLNIIVFDEQMNLVMTNDGKNSYFEQAGATNVLKGLYSNKKKLPQKNIDIIFPIDSTSLIQQSH